MGAPPSALNRHLRNHAVKDLAGTRAKAQGNDLCDAADKGDLSRVKALLKAKTDVSAKADNGLTALMWAKEHHHPHMEQLLKQAGAVR